MFAVLWALYPLLVSGRNCLDLTYSYNTSSLSSLHLDTDMALDYSFSVSNSNLFEVSLLVSTPLGGAVTIDDLLQITESDGILSISLYEFDGFDVTSAGHSTMSNWLLLVTLGSCVHMLRPVNRSTLILIVIVSFAFALACSTVSVDVGVPEGMIADVQASNIAGVLNVTFTTGWPCCLW